MFTIRCLLFGHNFVTRGFTVKTGVYDCQRCGYTTTDYSEVIPEQRPNSDHVEN